MNRTIAVVGGLMVGSAVVAGAQSVRHPCQAPGPHTVTACIMKPNEGATFTPGSIRVVLDSKNITIAPVAAGKPGAAHYHLFLDVGIDSWTDPIPTGNAGIVHLGQGQKEYTFENVGAGQHRLIVVLADNAHVPVPHQHADTTYFTVEGH